MSNDDKCITLFSVIEDNIKSLGSRFRSVSIGGTIYIWYDGGGASWHTDSSGDIKIDSMKYGISLVGDKRHVAAFSYALLQRNSDLVYHVRNNNVPEREESRDLKIAYFSGDSWGDCTNALYPKK